MDFIFFECVQKGKAILALWKSLQGNFNRNAESLNFIYNLLLSDPFFHCVCVIPLTSPHLHHYLQFQYESTLLNEV